ncbi:hypothetical protein HNR19_002555 [Nocardioides thalensis]|uniref:Uncharacterized protein n=1 Tax=Nocardioides thalensis TaxID=1914755 RepID=A0A853C3T3_9ACTN|nr:hypothetical protein [Nocardioides thalensis]NYJ01857.1 hypothetical protein [Nocardioides thalensis]
MSFSTTPPAARTDVQEAPLRRPRTMSRTTIRQVGVGLALGAAAWATSVAFHGFNPETETGTRVTGVAGLLFQCGLLALVHVHMATRATGTKKVNGWLLNVERLLLVLAIVWTLCHTALPSQRDATWLAVLDFSWPLSMLGMLLIGVSIAIKGRWRGMARAWSLVAETWVIVTMPALGILGESGGTVVGVAHLVLGYGALGLILAARPDLVVAVEDR